jgi:peptidoglycan/LPS O-acetylase OafA/YrhL
MIYLCIALMAAEGIAKRHSIGLFDAAFGSLYLWARIGPSFLLGMIAYSYRTRIPRSLLLALGLMLLAIASCWIHHLLAGFFVAPALAYGVFLFAFSERIKAHNAAKYGDFSYGCYLYAFPIQQILQATTKLSLPEFITTSMLLSLIAGTLSWHLVEKHFMRKTSKPLGKLATT